MDETSKRAFEITKNVKESASETLANVRSGGEVGELKAEIKNLQTENKQLLKERDFAKKIADMYVSELSLTVKRIKQNLAAFDQALKDKP